MPGIPFSPPRGNRRSWSVSPGRKARLTIPPVDKESISGISGEFEETMANGTNPGEKKHLLRRVVKKVLIHDRRTIEVRSCLPNRASVRTADYLAPRRGRLSNFPRNEGPGFSRPVGKNSAHLHDVAPDSHTDVNAAGLVIAT